MMTIAVSQGISWATYASDYSRYLRPTSSRAAIFWLTLGGLTASYVWVETIGLARASVLGNQTASGVRALMGGGTLGVLALIAIVFGAITSNSMNDYTGSLAFQALGARVRRPVTGALVAVLAFAAILWMHAGDTSGKFENILLFIGYWIAPFCAIVMIDWHYNRQRYTPSLLRNALMWRSLGTGWPAVVAFVLGFGAMVPFMNTSIIVGPVAKALQGADLAFYVGFIVTGALYYALRRLRPAAVVLSGLSLCCEPSRPPYGGRSVRHVRCRPLPRIQPHRRSALGSGQARRLRVWRQPFGDSCWRLRVSGGAFADNGGEVEPGEFAPAWQPGEECHSYDGCRGEGAGGGADVSVEPHEVAVERAEESCGGQSAEDEAGQDSHGDQEQVLDGDQLGEPPVRHAGHAQRRACRSSWPRSARRGRSSPG